MISLTQEIFCNNTKDCLANKIINIEEEVGFEVPDSALHLLDNILQRAAEIIRIKQQFTKNEALKFCNNF